MASFSRAPTIRPVRVNDLLSPARRMVAASELLHPCNRSSVATQRSQLAANCMCRRASLYSISTIRCANASNRARSRG